MRRIWRLGLVAAVAAASFAVAIGRFSDAAEKGCAKRVSEDSSYQVSFLEPPRMDMDPARYRLAVTRQGRPVTGATFCVNTYMQGMSAMATTDDGREVSPGTYEVSLTFQMGGDWKGRALIGEPGKPMVAAPLTLQVAEPDATPEPAPGSTATAPTTTTTAPATTTTEPPE